MRKVRWNIVTFIGTYSFLQAIFGFNMSHKDVNWDLILTPVGNGLMDSFDRWICHSGAFLESVRLSGRSQMESMENPQFQIAHYLSGWIFWHDNNVTLSLHVVDNFSKKLKEMYMSCNQNKHNVRNFSYWNTQTPLLLFLTYNEMWKIEQRNNNNLKFNISLRESFS